MIKTMNKMAKEVKDRLENLYLYVIRFSNGEAYGGATTDLDRRKVEHEYAAKTGTTPLYNRMRECSYTIETVKTFENCTGLEGINAEKELIKELGPNALNCTAGGNGFNGVSKEDCIKIYNYLKECKSAKETAEKFNITVATVYMIKKWVEPFESEGFNCRLERKKEVVEYFLKNKDIDKTLSEFGISKVTFNKYFKEFDEEGRTPLQYLKDCKKEEMKKNAHKKEVYDFFMKTKDIKLTLDTFKISQQTFYNYFYLFETTGKKPRDYIKAKKAKANNTIESRREVYDYFVTCCNINKTLDEFGISISTFRAIFSEFEKNDRKPSYYTKNTRVRKVFTVEERKEVYDYFIKCRNITQTKVKFNISEQTFYNYFYEFEKTGKKPSDYIRRKSRSSFKYTRKQKVNA